MEVVYKDSVQYISFKQGKANIKFFTAYNNTDFNMLCQDFDKNINSIKELFSLEDFGYCKQIHSDIINIYDGTLKCGDAIITDEKQKAIGVFTADCVPVLLYDAEKEVCAAVHSGWKGTYSKITYKVIAEMIEKYGCAAENISAYIGPHIRSCCYEVGSELIEKFSLDQTYQGHKIILNGKLDLLQCIRLQCLEAGIAEDSIYDTSLCTSCSETSKEIKLHSYRKMKEKSGRLLSLIYIEK